jgi:glutathione S-transferase
MPSGQVPVAEIDGKVVADSAAIQRQLEALFPERPLLPAAGTPERERADRLNRLERSLFGAWMQWLTSNWCVGGFPFIAF